LYRQRRSSLSIFSLSPRGRLDGGRTVDVRAIFFPCPFWTPCAISPSLLNSDPLILDVDGTDWQAGATDTLFGASAIEPPLWTPLQFFRYRAHPDDPWLVNLKPCQQSSTTSGKEVLMKKLCVVVAVLLLLPSAYLFSQEWSAAQKEVWKNVEAYSALADAGNVEGFLAYVHDNYMGWNYSSALPRAKRSRRQAAGPTSS
jgi:hypothetical protein